MRMSIFLAVGLTVTLVVGIVVIVGLIVVVVFLAVGLSLARMMVVAIIVMAVLRVARHGEFGGRGVYRASKEVSGIVIRGGDVGFVWGCGRRNEERR
jgi:hypothetical protein